MSGLLRVPLFDDEILISHVSRTARANGTSRMAAFCTDLGLDARAIRNGHSTAIERFATLLGYDPDRLMAQALRVCEDGSTFLFGHHFQKGMLCRTGFRYCPECLEEDERYRPRMPGTRRYLRARWMLKSMMTCVKHGRALEIADGQYKGQHLSDICLWLDAPYKNVSSPALLSEHRVPTPFEKFVEIRFPGQSTGNAFLDGLPLPMTIELSDLLGTCLLFGHSYHVKEIDGNARRRALDEGYHALARGESGVREALDRIVGHVKPGRVGGGQALYGRLYHVLERKPVAYDWLKAILRDHALACRPIHPAAPLFGKVDVGWTTLRDLASEAGLSEEVLYRHLVVLGFIGPGHRRAKNLLIAPDISAEVVASFRGALDTAGACKILGCNRRDFDLLVESGFIKRLLRQTGAGEVPGSLQRYSRQDVHNVRRCLEPTLVEPAADMVSVRKAIRIAGCSRAEFLDILLRKRLRKVARLEDHPLLASLLVDAKELRAVVAGNYLRSDCPSASNG
ncbi:TniQ family protein [Rhizobium sp. GCM10022189]|uniref:TniQ family protein n=1 Tax=Rhizobium sp. GCM10022189 TaxID=3252654 RepID=UPI0036187E48